MIKNFIKIVFLSLLMLGTFSYANDSIKIKEGAGNLELAKKIVKDSKSDSSFTQEAVQKFKITKEEIKKIINNDGNYTQDKLCEIRKQLLVDTSTIAKSIKPFIVLVMVFLFFLTVKKLFLDDHNAQPGALTSNVIRGCLYLLFAMMLTQYGSVIEWWEKSLIPDFSTMCGNGQSNALSTIIMTQLLYAAFIMIQFIGAIVFVTGLVELVKTNPNGKVNVSSVLLKTTGGVLLLSYQQVLSFLGIITIVS